MKINSKDFRVRPGKKFELKEWPTVVFDALKELKMSYPKTTSKRREELEAIGKALGK